MNARRCRIALAAVISLCLFLLIAVQTLTSSSTIVARHTTLTVPYTEGPADSEFLYKSGDMTAELSFRLSNQMLTQYGFPVRLNASPAAAAVVADGTTNGSIFSVDDGDEDFDLHSLVFVTAATDGRLYVDMDAIAIVQKQFPTNTIYFYDLSETPAAIVNKIRKICNLVYRKFDYSQYPDHVKDIFTYTFKPIIVHEILREHRHVFWMDASIRFRAGIDFRPVVRAASRGSHSMMFDTSGHAIFPATHAGMFKYLPMSKELAIGAAMHGANAIYIQLTQELYDNVLRWWFLCALVHDCMAPTTDLFCKFNGRDKYAQCHRYDQSALNILLVNYFGGDDRSYFTKYDVLSNNRGAQHEHQLHVCASASGRTTKNDTTIITSKDYFV